MATKLSKTKINDLNYQYLPALSVSNVADYLRKSAEKSRRVRRKLDCLLDLSYGDSPGQVLDIFPSPTPDAPVQVFIHGGYWRAALVNKTMYSHVAAPLVAAGATVILLDYDLCPSVRITDIAQQVRKALAWVYKNAHHYNGDRKRLFISGHSAGGHLGGMMISTDWSRQGNLPKQLVKGSLLLSGLFDIEPHRHTALQSDIRLTAREARAMSPLNWPAQIKSPCLLAVGSNEPDLFHWQSLAYAAHLRAQHVNAEYRCMPGDNHFSLVDRLGRAGDPLTRAMIAQMF